MKVCQVVWVFAYMMRTTWSDEVGCQAVQCQIQQVMVESWLFPLVCVCLHFKIFSCSQNGARPQHWCLSAWLFLGHLFVDLFACQYQVTLWTLTQSVRLAGRGLASLAWSRAAKLVQWAFSLKAGGPACPQQGLQRKAGFAFVLVPQLGYTSAGVLYVPIANTIWFCGH